MPNIHPFLVHFPIALLTAGLIAEFWALARRDGLEEKLGWWLQAAGTFGLLIAAASGLWAGQSVVIPEAARGTFDTHQEGAFVSSAVFAALALWRVGARGRLTGRGRVTFLLLYTAGLGAVLVTGWYGGKLVFEFGVGVGMNPGP